MGKIIAMHCQDKKQKSTEKLGKVVKPQQRTSLRIALENIYNTLLVAPSLSFIASTNESFPMDLLQKT